VVGCWWYNSPLSPRFISGFLQLSDYNFTSVTCEKSASSLTLPNTTGQVSSCSNTGSIRDNPYWTSRKNSLELIELSNINKVGLILVPPVVTLDQ
jgi:hypothetical protein